MLRETTIRGLCGLVCPSRTHRLCIRSYRYFAYVYIGILTENLLSSKRVFFNVSVGLSERPISGQSSRIRRAAHIPSPEAARVRRR